MVVNKFTPILIGLSTRPSITLTFTVTGNGLKNFVAPYDLYHKTGNPSPRPTPNYEGEVGASASQGVQLQIMEAWHSLCGYGDVS